MFKLAFFIFIFAVNIIAMGKTLPRKSDSSGESSEESMSRNDKNIKINIKISTKMKTNQVIMFRESEQEHSKPNVDATVFSNSNTENSDFKRRNEINRITHSYEEAIFQDNPRVITTDRENTNQRNIPNRRISDSHIVRQHEDNENDDNAVNSYRGTADFLMPSSDESTTRNHGPHIRSTTTERSFNLESNFEHNSFNSFQDRNDDQRIVNHNGKPKNEVSNYNNLNSKDDNDRNDERPLSRPITTDFLMPSNDKSTLINPGLHTRSTTTERSYNPESIFDDDSYRDKNHDQRIGNHKKRPLNEASTYNSLNSNNNNDRNNERPLSRPITTSKATPRPEVTTDFLMPSNDESTLRNPGLHTRSTTTERSYNGESIFDNDSYQDRNDDQRIGNHKKRPLNEASTYNSLNSNDDNDRNDDRPLSRPITSSSRTTPRPKATTQTSKIRESSSNQSENFVASDGSSAHHGNAKKEKRKKQRLCEEKYMEYMVRIFRDDDTVADVTDSDFDGRDLVEPGEYPHMTALGYTAPDQPIDYKCGGSLISENFVLTAAHCTNLTGQAPQKVRIGDLNLMVEERYLEPQIRNIRRIFIHPQYSSHLYYNDIALLELKEPVEFTEFVRPIRLWTDGDLPENTTVHAMGYGATAFGKAPTHRLTDMNLTIVPNYICNRDMPDITQTPSGIISSQICARDYIMNRDTCQGDSGGPLQLNLRGRRRRSRKHYQLIGITSYGSVCRSNYPSVYTRVSEFLDWLEQIVWQAQH